jgi:hypothetical protein
VPPPKAVVFSVAVLLFPVPLNVAEPIVEPASVKLTWPVGAPAEAVDTVDDRATLLWKACVVGAALPVVVVAVPTVTFAVVAHEYTVGVVALVYTKERLWTPAAVIELVVNVAIPPAPTASEAASVVVVRLSNTWIVPAATLAPVAGDVA